MIQHRVIVIEPNGTVTSKAFNNVKGKLPGHYIDQVIGEVALAYYGRAPFEQHPSTLTIHYSLEDL